MNISLHPKNETFIQEQLQDGRYSSVDEVINEAIAVLRSLCKGEKYAAEVEQQIEAGQATDGEQVFDHLQEKLDGGRSVMPLEEIRKMIGTDKPA